MTFGTLIKVVVGFYMGCVGVLTSPSFIDGEYSVDLYCKDKAGYSYHMTGLFPKESLAPITEAEWRNYHGKEQR